MKIGKNRFMIGAVLAFWMTMTGVAGAQEQDSSARLDRLRSQIGRVTRGADGRIGIAVKHLESGQTLEVNGDMLFPMASVFKVPVLVELLYQVKDGRYTLEDEIAVEKSDQHPGSGMISKLAMPGMKLSVLNMAYSMMMISDNSAADILLAKVGAENINARLKSLGITGMTVDRSCQKLIADYRELMAGSRRPEERKAAIVKFGEIPQDRTTPVAMNLLLEKIFRREIPDEELGALAVQIMLKCETGGTRIKGELPRGTVVAHKTGTIAGTVNDCGIIYLPDNQGHIALTILTKDFTADTSDVENIIAKIARLVYDYFYFTG